MFRKWAAIACMIFLAGAVFLPSLVFAGSATVSWQANTEPDLAKYRVYWSTTAGSYGSYKAEVAKGTNTYTASTLTDGQTYYFVVTAVDTSGNESGFSSPPASKTISGGSTGVPAAPAQTTPASGAHVPGTSVTFTWQAAAGATDYNVKVYTSSGWLTYDQWVGNNTSHNVTGFDNTGRSFSWAVTARNQAGEGPVSAKWAFVNDGTGSTPTVPGAPVLTSPANGANVPGTNVTFSWQAVQGATDYNLKVSDANGGTAYNGWVGNAQSFTVNGFPNSGGTYNWTVTARNSAGQGSASASRSFVNGTSSTPTVPGAPVLTSPANGANVPGTNVTFSWQAVQGATDYNLKVSDANGGTAYNGWVGNAQSFTVNGFPNSGGTYNWTVTARNSAGQGSASASRSFVNGTSSTPTVPGAPVLTSPANGAHVPGSSVTFTWQAIQGATDYNIKIYTSTGWLTYDRSVGNVTSHNVTGFGNTGRSFAWTVTARTQAGQGPASARWTFVNDGASTTPTVPTAPVLTSPANGANVPGTSVTFSWQAVQGATDYNLKVTDANGGTAYNGWVGNAQTFTVNGFPNSGGSYNWTVTARNSAGQGPASAARSFVNGTSSTATKPATAPVLASPINGAQASGTSVTFKWQPVAGATDYNLRIYTSTGWLTYDRWVGNATSYTVTGFDSTGRSFTWAVTASNAAGQGPTSPRTSFVNR